MLQDLTVSTTIIFINLILANYICSVRQKRPKLQWQRFVFLTHRCTRNSYCRRWKRQVVLSVMQSRCSWWDKIVNCFPKRNLWFPGLQISWVNDWSSEYAIFLHGLAQQWWPQNEIWHKCSLGDEHDTHMSSTCTAQRKCAIPHSTMRVRRNMWRLF